MKKTSNIEAYVEWFNRLSYLVATEICVSDKKRNRTKLVEFFMDTAMECKRLHNFNSYMAISGEITCIGVGTGGPGGQDPSIF